MSKSKIVYDKKGVKEMEMAMRAAFRETAKETKKGEKAAQEIPYDTGAAQKSLKNTYKMNYDEKRTSLGTGKDYMQKLYYHPEYNFQTKHNKNARAYWFENLIEGNRTDNFVDSLIKNTKKALK